MKQHIYILFILVYTSVYGQWNKFSINSKDTIKINCINVLDQTIWAVGVRYNIKNDSYVFSNSDQAWVSHFDNLGQNWKTYPIPIGNDVFITSLSAINDSTAYVSGMYDYKHARTLKTSDGGANWTDITPNLNPDFSYIAFINFKNDQEGVLISDPNIGEFQIFRTTNGGTTWNLLNAINIPDAFPAEFSISGWNYNEHLWFTTSYGRIFHSENYGNTWSVYQSPIGYIEGVRFSDAQHGILSPGYTAQELLPTPIFTTDDGGINWNQLDLTTFGEKVAVFGYEYIPNSTYIMLTTCTGSLLTGDFATWISPDRGASWQQISSGENIFTLNFLNANTGWGGEGQQFEHPTRMFKYTGSPLVGIFSGKTLTENWSISPNPCKDHFNLQIETDKTMDYLLLINDVQGKLVYSTQFRQEGDVPQTIQFGSVPAGMYVVTLTNKDGKVSKILEVL